MAKTVKSLSGAEKDAFLTRAAAAAGVGKADGEALAQRLSADVTRVWVKIDALTEEVGSEDATAATDPSTDVDAFDPFTPNVVVVLRRAGAASALAELQSITSAERLKLLAREQQLTIAADLADARDIRAAIVAAAERRVANRRAAAS